MKFKEIYIPYSKVKKIQFSQRLLLETGHEEYFIALPIEHDISGVYGTNRIQRMSNIISHQMVNYVIRIYINNINDLTFDKKSLSFITSNMNNSFISILYGDIFIENEFGIKIIQVRDNFIMDISFYSDEFTRNAALKNEEYINYIADRFRDYLAGEDFLERKEIDFLKRKRMVHLREK